MLHQETKVTPSVSTKALSFGPSERLFQTYPPEKISSLTIQLLEAIEMGDFPQFQEIITENPLLMKLKYAESSLYLFLLSLRIDADDKFLLQATKCISDLGYYFNANEIKNSDAVIFSKDVDKNAFKELLHNDNMIYDYFLENLDSRIKKVLSDRKELPSHAKQILLCCVDALLFVKTHFFARSELLELYFTINSLLIITNQTKTNLQIESKVMEFLSAREDMLCGERFDYCNTLTLANELCCRLTQVLFPDESPGDLLFYNALTRDRRQRWQDSISGLYQLPDCPKSYFRNSNNKIHLYQPIVEQAIDRLIQGNTILEEIWLGTDVITQEEKEIKSLTSEDREILKSRSPQLKKLVEYSEIKAGQNHNRLLKKFVTLRAGLEQSDVEHTGHEYEAGVAGYRAVIDFLSWWNELAKTKPGKELRKKIHKLDNGNLGDIIKKLTDEGEEKIFDKARTTGTFCTKLIGRDLDDILRNDEVKKQFAELEESFELSKTNEELRQWQQEIITELNTKKPDYRDCPKNFFAELVSLPKLKWLLSLEQEFKLLSYVNITNEDKELFLVLKEKIKNQAPHIAFDIYQTENLNVLLLLFPLVSTINPPTMLSYAIKLKIKKLSQKCAPNLRDFIQKSIDTYQLSMEELHFTIQFPTEDNNDWVLLVDLCSSLKLNNESTNMLLERALASTHDNAFSFIEMLVNKNVTLSEKHVELAYKANSLKIFNFMLTKNKKLNAESVLQQAMNAKQYTFVMAYLNLRKLSTILADHFLETLLIRKESGSEPLILLLLQFRPNYPILVPFKNSNLIFPDEYVFIKNLLNVLKSSTKLKKLLSSEFLNHICESVVKQSAGELDSTAMEIIDLLIDANIVFTDQQLDAALENNHASLIPFLLKSSKLSNEIFIIHAAQLGNWESILKFLAYREVSSSTLDCLWHYAYVARNLDAMTIISKITNRVEYTFILSLTSENDWLFLEKYLQQFAHEKFSDAFIETLFLKVIAHKRISIIEFLCEQKANTSLKHLQETFNLGAEGKQIMGILLDKYPELQASNECLKENEIANWVCVSLYLSKRETGELGNEIRQRHKTKILNQFNQILTNHVADYQTKTPIKNQAIEIIQSTSKTLLMDPSKTEAESIQTLLEILTKQKNMITTYHANKLFKMKKIPTLNAKLTLVQNEFKAYLQDNHIKIPEVQERALPVMRI